MFHGIFNHLGHVCVLLKLNESIEVILRKNAQLQNFKLVSFSLSESK